MNKNAGADFESPLLEIEEQIHQLQAAPGDEEAERKIIELRRQ